MNGLLSVVINSEKIGGTAPSTRNMRLYTQAVTHNSVSDTECYERLEFLGDSVIGFVVAEYLHARFDDQPESFLTDMKIRIVNSDMLAWLCQCMGLHRHVRVEENIKYEKVYEDVFEAFVGAFYLQNGLDAARQFVVALLENPNFVDMTRLILHDGNYKKRLMMLIQKHTDGRMPVFHTLDFMDTNTFHIVVCHPNGDVLGIGVSKTIKLAQQSACKMALDHVTAESLSAAAESMLSASDLFGARTRAPRGAPPRADGDDVVNDFNVPVTRKVVCEIWDMYRLSDDGAAIFDVDVDKIDTSMYQSAFIHKLWSNMNDPYYGTYKSNERLNFLGNSLLMYLITQYLYETYPDEAEGFLTKIKTAEIESKNVQTYARLLQLERYVVLPRFEEHARAAGTYGEQAFCALLAAMYLDQGAARVRAWTFEMWRRTGRMRNVVDENYKHQLLLKIQENPAYKFYRYPFPTYRIVPDRTNYENKVFTVEVLDPKETVIGEGCGPTKKDAEQAASRAALAAIAAQRPGSAESSV